MLLKRYEYCNLNKNLFIYLFITPFFNSYFILTNLTFLIN